jgi:hypothetical protein
VHNGGHREGRQGAAVFFGVIARPAFSPESKQFFSTGPRVRGLPGVKSNGLAMTALRPLYPAPPESRH